MTDLAPGFADPVFDSQRAFRAAMNAMARPGTILRMDAAIDPPPATGTAFAAVALALLDHETPVWLDPELAAMPGVAAWLRFHTGAPVVGEPADAAFALIARGDQVPPFERFATGTDAYPDRGATLLVQIEAFEGPPITLAGPGIDGTREIAARPLPDDFAARLGANRALFPRGVDLILCAGDRLAALPRSVRVIGGVA